MSTMDGLVFIEGGVAALIPRGLGAGYAMTVDCGGSTSKDPVLVEGPPTFCVTPPEEQVAQPQTVVSLAVV